MSSEPVAVDAAQFFEFIGSSGLVVLLISAHPLQTFSEPLSAQLAGEHREMALGTIDLADLIMGGGPALHFLHHGLRTCGAPSYLGVLPGYCLFRNRELLAWDAGLPRVADVEAVAQSALLGAICSGVTRNPSFVLQALRWAVDQIVAERVAFAFREALAGRANRRATSSRHWARPPIDEVKWAYDVLGVSPNATDREVHQAWRRRRMEVHPDYAVGDPVEFNRRSRLSAEINRARDIIVRHRSVDAGYARAS